MERLLARGENLRKAIRWISDLGDHSYQAVEAACRRFDLSPADEEFVIKHFTQTDEADRP